MKNWVFIKDCVDIYTTVLYWLADMLVVHANWLVKRYLPELYEED